MNESKSTWPRDRLSELPESLIFHIFWLLPMRDVVRTTILSKHWKNLWTTTPFLNFDYDFEDDFDYDFDGVDRFRNFVNGALIMWEGIKIQKFKINFHTHLADNSFHRDFNIWLCFALRKKVQELYVYNPCDGEGSLPQNLYSCSSLRVLSLIDCRLEMNGNVQWNQLQSLTVYGAYMREDAINQVLCGSPQLEVFILTHHKCSENLSIRSSSLKRLSIDYNIDSDHPWLVRELRIWTPNLETLHISGVPYNKCLLMDVSSLTHVTLGFNSQRDQPFVDESDLLGETLRQIFPTIQHVEKVTLSACCIKVLGDLIKKGLLPLTLNAKFLKLNNRSAQCNQIVGVLEIFPKLEMLVLKGDKRYHYQHVQELIGFDENLPRSFLLHLRTIEITWNDDDNSIFLFILIVLKHASKLEKMVIRVMPPAPPSNSPFWAFQKLLTMRRSSPTVELIFCEFDLTK